MAISPTDPLAGPVPLTAAPKPPPPSRRGLLSEIGRHRNDYLWVAPALLVMLLVIAYPFFYTIDLSFYDTPPSSPNWYFNGVNNYVQVLSHPSFWAITLNTVYWAVGSTALAFLIGLGAALVIQREFIGRSLVRGLLMIPYVISYVAAAYVWRWLYHSDYGLISGQLYDWYIIDSPINFLDSTTMVMPSLIIANVWKEFPFAMIMLLAGLQTVPRQLLNAARVDGANAWNRFWHVTVPTLRGVIIITSILLFVGNLNSFGLVWILTGGGPANASQIWITEVYTLAFQSLQYGRASAYSVILFIVMLGPVAGVSTVSVRWSPLQSHHAANAYAYRVATFPAEFLWGAATAAYQIEGAVAADGRGESIWDRFSHTPGAVLNGETGDVADDHYHRWRGDIALMQELGLKAYRFSIAWPRIFPEGTGAVNPAGLDFYDRLVDGLVDAGITPFVTLYHWDLPQALQDHGGWANPACVDAFADYAATVAQRLGDRVHHWITHNEPWVVAFVGNYQGRHAPGLRDLETALRVAHNLLLSHARAVPRLRAAAAGSQVGITLNFSTSRPASASPEDALAAALHDQYLNRWFLDPLSGRGYPAELAHVFGDRFVEPLQVDLAEIAAPLDFLGVNYYFPNFLRPGGEFGFESLPQPELSARGYELTAMGWPVVPDAFHELLSRISRDYQPAAIYVTENGAAFDDQPSGGRIRDERRIAYLHSHLGAVHQAMADGVPVRGYFVWSLLDNFEWALGYSKRFGVVYVDYSTQARVVKDSGRWYQQVVTTNQLSERAIAT